MRCFATSFPTCVISFGIYSAMPLTASVKFDSSLLNSTLIILHILNTSLYPWDWSINL